MDSFTKIDIKAVLEQKAPKVARRIPGWLIAYLAKTIHQAELNEILSRYHDQQGVDFMRSMIDYFDLHFELIHSERVSSSGAFHLCGQPSVRGIRWYLPLYSYR